MSVSRWLTWTPKAPIIEKMPDPEPTKPSKMISEGFEGATSALFTIVECSPAEMDAATSQIFRWIRTRCVRRREIWSSEKSLWRDYFDWCHQDKRSVVQRERFAEILDESFRREMDGWQGIALAIDIVANTHIM
jgi:hypothetical protein